MTVTVKAFVGPSVGTVSFNRERPALDYARSQTNNLEIYVNGVLTYQKDAHSSRITVLRRPS